MRTSMFLALTLVWLVAVPAAFAGGWAVTTLDAVPSNITAGETYPIGYTIRQHGTSGFVGAASAIEVRDASGALVERFAGRAEGAPGHYVAQVRFASAGEWQWSVDQSPFQPQALGTINVAAPAAGTPPREQLQASVIPPDPIWSIAPTLALLGGLALALRATPRLRSAAR